MSRSGTHRSQEMPEGNLQNAKVVEANRVRDGVVFLMILLAASDRRYLVGQPLSSLVSSSHAFSAALALTSAQIVSFDDAAFDDEEA